MSSCDVGGVLSPSGASSSDLGLLEDDCVGKSILPLLLTGVSAGADSDRALVFSISGSLERLGDTAELAGSSRPSALRLRSPAPIVRTAESFWFCSIVLEASSCDDAAVVWEADRGADADGETLDAVRALLMPRPKPELWTLELKLLAAV